MRTRVLPVVIATLLLSPATALAQSANNGDRDRAQAPYRVGLENFKAEAWDDAIRYFKEAIDIDSTFDMAYYMLGRTHMAQKKFGDAVGAYERCKALHQQQSGRQYATAQERQRDRDTRLREIDDMIRTYQSIANPNQQVSDSIRQLQNRRREIQEAMARGNSTMSLNLTVPAYVSTALGSAYFRMGNLANAEKEYRAAIEADGKAGEAHSNLAVVYMETGRLDEADKSIQAAEKIGFRVHPQLKEEIKNRRKAGSL
jgi:tetratricopeptide (TPR) repeat protein